MLEYKDAECVHPGRAVVVLRYLDAMCAHQTMHDALSKEIVAWCETNVRQPVTYDVWDERSLCDRAGIEFTHRDSDLLGSFYFVFQFASDTEAAMFKLAFPAVGSLPMTAPTA